VCNPTVKFKALCDEADRNGSEYVATGHYARVLERDGVFILRKAACLARDQSYMLYSLSQAQLARLVLPLGERAKADVRALAKADALPSASAPDSQEICFIPDGDYPAYIAAKGLRGKSGRFIAPDGSVLGAHDGVEHYTVGQRRGLRVSLGRPVFVRRILGNGDIELAFADGEFDAGVEIAQLKLNPAYTLKSGDAYSVKLRSAARPAGCRIGAADGQGCTLVFDTPQRAPAPGQSAVLYDGELLVGGGVIGRCL
ncbi:MAG: tRNA-specific 2-thiouridylase, partial [Oscillospiraceae bacterium]|nr:tRNA-specific 2-thiouridylase [Oscillospiraceae bacterium]